MQGIHYQVSPPLMGGDQGEGEQKFNHPHLSFPIEGEEQYGDPIARAGNYQVKLLQEQEKDSFGKMTRAMIAKRRIFWLLVSLGFLCLFYGT